MRKYSTLFHSMFKSYRDPNYKIFLLTKHTDDKEWPYSTILTHPSYNEGKSFCISQYKTIEEAFEGNEYWHTHITGATKIVTNGHRTEDEFFLDASSVPSLR